MDIRYVPMPHWPPLAWRARCRMRSVTVEHGTDVETMPEWFCEAVWDGDYISGDFDQTDIVAGSGGRVRGNRVTFVSSGSTVDRLQSFRDGDTVYVSNSLVALLAVTERSVDPTYPYYARDFSTIKDGLVAARTTVAGVTLTYFSNLQWDGRELMVVVKPQPYRRLTSFAEYRTFLVQTLRAVAENLRAPSRRLRYEPLATLSSGYDSPTVTVLAREAFGLDEVLTFSRDRGGGDDSGERIADVVGVKVRTLDRDDWRHRADTIIPFLAANGRAEDVNFAAAERLLPGRVLFTGYYGGKVWDPHTGELSPDIVRGDTSGLSLTEFRLWTRFLHCPVPFFGTRQIRDIHAINTSPEMAPWDVGGDYTRPICRRIVEEAGVPRHLFGTAKRATSVVIWYPDYSVDDPLLPDGALPQYRRWLAARTVVWLRRGRVPPLLITGVARFVVHGDREALVHRLFVWLLRRLRGTGDDWETVFGRLFRQIERGTLFSHLFPWAIEVALRRYR